MGLTNHIVRRDAGSQWLVGLHGLQSNSEVFTDLLNDPRFQSFSFLGIDLIGFGKSPKPASFSYDLADQADLVLEVLARENIARATFIGHSVGGMIGTLLLKRAPQIVSQFISLEGNLTREDCGVSLPASQVASADRAAFFENLKKRIAEEPLSGAGRARWLDQVSEVAFFETSRSIVRWSESGELYEIFQSGVHRKMLILGQNSGFRSRPAGPHITPIVIKGAGHFMLTEKPRETLRAMAQFLF